MLAIVWLTVSALAWGVVRSDINQNGVDNGTINAVPVEVSVIAMLVLAMPLFASVLSSERIIWLLGASVTIGLMPSVPLMPYVHEAAHLAFIILAMKALSSLLSIKQVIANSLPLRTYAVFLSVCVISMVLGQLSETGGLWEFKVGTAEMILYTSFSLALVALVKAGQERAFHLLLDGFAWAALAQIAVMLLAITLSLTMELVPGNDSMFGLGYWDRVKSLFSGPDQAGVFFSASIPVIILWSLRAAGGWTQAASSAYLQLVPWFIMASGSRTARIAMIVSVGTCLFSSASRPHILRALPSLVLAAYVGLMYQSFPTALEAFAMRIADSIEVVASYLPLQGGSWLASKLTAFSGALQAHIDQTSEALSVMSLSGRFFQDSRWQLISQAWAYFASAPFLNKLFGFGVGVSGYRLAVYPSAHSSIDFLIETGLVGLTILAAFFAVLAYRLTLLVRTSPRDGYMATTASLLLGALLAASVGFATYKAHTWGFVMVLYSMAVLVTPDLGCWLESSENRSASNDSKPSDV